MSYEMGQLGARSFNHSPSSGAEQEYDRLRDLARKELSAKQRLGSQAHEAYERGDGARAHQLSEQAKQHGSKMDQYNHQASDYIFRENNANLPGDTIDLHGQYVEEAERILRLRIQTARQQNQSHLHVIVGKGNHSVNHVQKIKPAVEQLCQEMGLRFRTEENEGRMYVELGQTHPPGQGGYVDSAPPPLPSGFQNSYYGGGNYGAAGAWQHQGGGYPAHQQQQHHGGYPGQQQYHGGNQQQQQNDDVEKVVNSLFRSLGKCCVIM